MKTIETNLTEHPILVDEKDFEFLSQFKWHAWLDKSGNRYAISGRARRKYGTGYLHRILLRVQKGMQTDHVNGNGMDNRRQNLRVCTRSDNQKNKHKRKPGTSKFKGVHWDRSRGEWFAQIWNEGKKVFLGRHKKEADAAKAYDAAAIKFFASFACVNFPNHHSTLSPASASARQRSQAVL